MAVFVVIALVAAAFGVAVTLLADSTTPWDDAREFGPATVPMRLQASVGAMDLTTFAVVGDTGVGTQSQRDVARRMCRWRRNHPYDVVLTTGDNVYPDGRPSNFAPNFFEPFKCLLNKGVRFRAVLGNHDIMTDNGTHQVEEPTFGMRARNYVFRREGVRFVMMNSNRVRLGWLEKALQPQEGDVYTVVSMHHPVYSPGPHGSTPGFRPELTRAFRSAGVDLVLAGHDHLYSVSNVRGGIRYVVTGGGGAPLYPCSERWFVDVCRSRRHFLYVTVDSEAMRVRAVPAFGKVFDRFRVVPD